MSEKPQEGAAPAAPKPEPKRRRTTKTESNREGLIGLGVLVLVTIAAAWLGIETYKWYMQRYVQTPPLSMVAPTPEVGKKEISPFTPKVVAEEKLEEKKVEQSAPLVPATTTEAPKTRDNVALNASGGKVELKFDPCACKTCSTLSPKKAPKVVRKEVHKPPVVAVFPAEAILGPADRIWLWHPHDATDRNPKPCIIEHGNGEGLPPYCSGLAKDPVPANPGETKAGWLQRVGGGHRPTDTGFYQKQ